MKISDLNIPINYIQNKLNNPSLIIKNTQQTRPEKNHHEWSTTQKILAIAGAVIGISAGIGWLLTWNNGLKFDAGCNMKFDPNCQRKITIVDVFDNSKNSDRKDISDLTSDNHQLFAKHYGLEHEIYSSNLVEKQCFNPITQQPEDCSPYWNKIKYFVNWCAQSSQQGKEEWALYLDDDAVFTNFQINPSQAIDALRGDFDTSFITATEGDGQAANTGVLIVRKDVKGCSVIEKIWQLRNERTPHESFDNKCPTRGICHDQRHGDEQGAVDRVLFGEPGLMNDSVSRLPSRDNSKSPRTDIAFNTLYRQGCIAAFKNEQWTDLFDIGEHDSKVNPSGIWKEKDWIGQTGGLPLLGQDHSAKVGQQCKGAVLSRQIVEPLREKWVQKMIDLAKKTYRPQITLGTAYDNGGSQLRDHVSDFSNKNHEEYANKWGLNHVISKTNLVQNACQDPSSRKNVDCVGYWNKIQRIREWLNENLNKESQILMVIDDDMLILNHQINPWKAIQKLGKDASVIIVKDVINWLDWRFPNTINDPRAAVNTGLIILKNDQASHDFFEEVWRHRNDQVSNDPICPTLGLCKNQNCLHEQEATAKVLKDHPNLLNKNIVATPSPREPERFFAVNAFKRDGCFVRQQNNWHANLFSYEKDDQKKNPGGACQKGDWMCQVAGVPIEGKLIRLQSWQDCSPEFVDQQTLQSTPVTEVRFEYLKEMKNTMEIK